MTSRERVQTALAHEEPDRVPLDLGGTVVSSIALSTYGELRKCLGLPERRVTVLETVQQIAAVDEDVQEALGLDVIPVFANAPAGYQAVFAQEPGGAVSFRDEFGATLRKPPTSHYYDWQAFPLKEASLSSLASVDWPDPRDPARYRGLRERTLDLRASTDKALFGMAPCGHDLLNQLFRVRGMEAGLMDLVENVEFVEAFLDRLSDTIIAAQEAYLREVGDLIDVHFAADDLAGQDGPLLSPVLYRRLVKPRWARITAAIRAKTRAPLFYHSCGAVADLIPDLIDVGVDILNPVQLSAADMDSAGLKRRFGRRISFWGGGCDTQKVLPRGTADEVRREVERRVRDLAPGGGFVFTPVHNVQPNVPAGNVVAAYTRAREAGRYPIRTEAP